MFEPLGETFLLGANLNNLPQLQSHGMRVKAAENPSATEMDSEKVQRPYSATHAHVTSRRLKAELAWKSFRSPGDRTDGIKALSGSSTHDNHAKIKRTLETRCRPSTAHRTPHAPTAAQARPSYSRCIAARLIAPNAGAVHLSRNAF